MSDEVAETGNLNLLTTSLVGIPSAVYGPNDTDASDYLGRPLFNIVALKMFLDKSSLNEEWSRLDPWFVACSQNIQTLEVCDYRHAASDIFVHLVHLVELNVTWPSHWVVGVISRNAALKRVKLWDARDPAICDRLAELNHLEHLHVQRDVCGMSESETASLVKVITTAPRLCELSLSCTETESPWFPRIIHAIEGRPQITTYNLFAFGRRAIPTSIKRVRIRMYHEQTMWRYWDDLPRRIEEVHLEGEYRAEGIFTLLPEVQFPNLRKVFIEGFRDKASVEALQAPLARIQSVAPRIKTVSIVNREYYRNEAVFAETE